MAVQLIENRDGTFSQISDGYKPSIIVGPPIPAEDSSKWHPGRERSEEEVLARYGATRDQLTQWQSTVGFPKPYLTTRDRWTLRGNVPVVKARWPEYELDAFDEKIRD